MKLFLSLVLILTNLGLTSTYVDQPLYVISNASNSKIEIITSNQYQNHLPIHIDSDDDFISLGFPGNGELENPYRIEGYQFTGSNTTQHLIFINNIESHFVIQNNNFQGNGYSGIYIRETNSGSIINNIFNSTIDSIYVLISSITISDNYFTNTGGGIYLWESYNSEISNNTINNAYYGISVNGGSETVISNNYIDNVSGSGIYARQPQYEEISLGFTIMNNTIKNANYGIVSGCEDSQISYNQILNSRYTGISLDYNFYGAVYSGRPSVVTFNSIVNSQLNGISLFSAKLVTLSNNEIINSNDAGITLSGESNTFSNDNNFTSNVISNSGKYGVHIFFYAHNNYFTNNNFIENNLGNLQANDLSKNNIFQLNYWDDLTNPDEDGNGIVDQPYEFSDNSDKYPLTRPNDGVSYRSIIHVTTTTTISSTSTSTAHENIYEQIVVIHEVDNSKEYISISLFIIFSIIGIVSVLGKNPIYNKTRAKLKSTGREIRQSFNPNHPSPNQNINIDIFCNSCGTVNPPQSRFCTECGGLQTI